MDRKRSGQIKFPATGLGLLVTGGRHAGIQSSDSGGSVAAFAAPFSLSGEHLKFFQDEKRAKDPIKSFYRELRPRC